MQISIETNVTSQFAEGYGKYYAKYMQNLHVRIVMTVFLVMIAIPSIYFQKLPDPGSDFQGYVFDVIMPGVMVMANHVPQCLFPKWYVSVPPAPHHLSH